MYRFSVEFLSKCLGEAWSSRFGRWTFAKKSLFSQESYKRSLWQKCTCLNGRNTMDEIVRREPKIARAIFHHTEISRDHMTPEIQLFLLTPNCPLYHLPFQSISEEDPMERNVFHEPFWSIYWPGGQTLARFLLDEGKGLVSTSRNVLDVGAGCGAVAIAVKLTGARRVVANDINEVACIAISMNAALNHVHVEISRENLLYETPEKSVDVIFIGDMLYDEEISSALIPWLEKARQNGTRIYLSDPGRHGLTEDLKKRLKILKRYSLPENIRKENHGYDTCSVYEFCT